MTDATAARIWAGCRGEDRRFRSGLHSRFRRRRPSGLAGRHTDVLKLSLHPVLSHKAISETVLASVCPRDPEFQSVSRDVVVGLAGIAPKIPVEAMFATQMIGCTMPWPTVCGWRAGRPSRFAACTSTTPIGWRGPSADWLRLSSGSATRAVRPWSSSTFAAVRPSEL